MVLTVHAVLLVIAIVLFVVAALGVNTRRVNLWYLGWAFVIAALVVA